MRLSIARKSLPADDFIVTFFNAKDRRAEQSKRKLRRGQKCYWKKCIKYASYAFVCAWENWLKRNFFRIFSDQI